MTNNINLIVIDEIINSLEDVEKEDKNDEFDKIFLKWNFKS